MKLRVVLEPSEDGGFTALVPALPGCISEGDSREQALANTQEAIQLYLEPVDDDVRRRAVSTAILYDGDTIWLGTEGEGIRLYPSGSKSRSEIACPSGLASNFVISFAVDRTTGTVWAGTVSGGITAIRKRGH